MTDLETGAVGLTPDERGGDVRVQVLVFQVDDVRHTAWDKQLISLWNLVLKRGAVYIPGCKRTVTKINPRSLVPFDHTESAIIWC